MTLNQCKMSIKNFNMTYPRDEDSDPYKQVGYRSIQEIPKIDKMGKLKRELEFLERGLQRVKM